MSDDADADSDDVADQADQEELLAAALHRASKLVTELEQKKADLEAHPPDLPPAQLAEGRVAMEQAVASARRMLVALQQAWEVRPSRMRPLDRESNDSDQAQHETDEEDQSEL
jgi:hypothetical protein